MTLEGTVFFVNGLRSSSENGRHLISCLESDPDLVGLRFIRFDYVSPRMRRPWFRSRIPDYDDLSRELKEFVDAHAGGQQPLAAVGYSQGGLILQRLFATALNDGLGQELARWRLAVFLGTPNGGSDFLGWLRWLAAWRGHPQERALKPFDKAVAEAHRRVCRQIDQATLLDDHHCPIPLFAYSGSADNVVSSVSAHGHFKNIGVLPGNHSTVLDPRVSGNITAATLKRRLLDAFDVAGRTA